MEAKVGLGNTLGAGIHNRVLANNNQLLLAKAASRGSSDIEIARIYLKIKEFAERNASLFEDITKSDLKGDALYQKIEKQGLDFKQIAAILLVQYGFSPAQLKEVFNSEKIALTRGSSAANFALKGLAQISLQVVEIRRKPKLRELIDYREQEKCLEIIKRLTEWVSNPRGKIPGETIALPLTVMIKLIPWLDGREDQLVSKYRDLIQAGKIKGSRSFNRAFAWFELKGNGVISLTISAKSKEDSKSEVNFQPILARYMVAAATHKGGLHIDTSRNGFTTARFLLSRAQAAEKIRELYPQVGDRRIIQESLIMLGGGAINLLEFEEPRHLKVAKKEVKVQGQDKLSQTACLTVISSLEIEKEKEGKLVTRKCKAVVGMPSPLTLDQGISNCKIVVGREAVHKVALTGSFVGCHFELVGKGEDKTLSLGKLFFKEQKRAVMPRFVFQNSGGQKNSIQASNWGKLALEWVSKNSANAPIGFLKLTVSRAPNKNHTFVTLGKKTPTLINFPKTIQDLIAYPVSMGAQNISQRYVFLFTEDGKLAGVLGFDRQNQLKGATPYSPKAPLEGVAWNSFKEKAAQIWSTAILPSLPAPSKQL